MTCDMCGGSLQHLGVLGNLEHVCCRDCGMMYYTEKLVYELATKGSK